MPKKSARYAHMRESAAAAVVPVKKTKCHRSVHIGPRNGRRWLSLKKRLGLLTDDDLIVYLLDLADSIAARDETCNDEPEAWKIQRGQDKKVLDNAETDSPVHDACQMDLPRRSQRKLHNSQEHSKSEKSDVQEGLANFSSALDKLPQANAKSKASSRTSKTKRHKSKARHHKEKRKKRKHQKIKDLQTLVNVENRLATNVSSELDSETDTEKPINFQDNFMSQTMLHQLPIDSNSLNSNKIQEDSHPDESQLFSLKINKTDTFAHQKFVNTTCVKDQGEVEALENQNTYDIEVENKSDNSNKTLSNSLESSQPSHSIKILQDKKDTENSPILNHDNSNRKCKRSKHEFSNSSSTPVELKKDDCDQSIPLMHKRDKKRHKGTDHQSKKHRDVRKAPQDGMVTSENQDLTFCTNDVQTLGDTTNTVPANNILPSEAIIENVGIETPRLAIKIKLCQECNNRHLQDACPLTEPEYSIKDSITLDQWIQKHNKNSEVIKAYSSNDPMSHGYSKNTDDGFESDDEASEQYKSKTKIECEEKQQTVDVNRPLYARDSLPDCLEFKLSNGNHGLSVFVKSLVPMYAQLGPLIGKPVQEMDIPDDFPMRHIWEVESHNKTLYISTTNPLTSNWIRYVRPAETKDDRNVAVISKNGELFLVTSKILNAGTELTYWSDSQSTAWARKNKIDKTNCGGCNLNFVHPIYYRLHCCIFHDTNYSLTIRKYHCKVCGAAVLGKDNIMKHAAQLHAGRGAYQCQYCKKFFLRLNYLEMHRTYGCSQNPQRSRPLCDFCGRKFCQPQKLKVHIKRMHSDMSEVLREFQCKLCLKLLGSRAALQRHMKEVHHKDVVGAATCDRCGKMFQNKSNLKIHMLTHSGVKPFKCKENGCKAAFTTKQCLQFHYKKVHGLNEDMMPKIERSVAYTFDAYSGGLVEDVGRGKTPKFNEANTQENSDSLASFDDCSSENNNTSSVTELPCNSSGSGSNQQLKTNEEPNQSTAVVVAATESPVESAESDVDLYGTSREINKANKKWTDEFDPTSSTPPPDSTADIYDFQENRREEEKQHSTGQSLCDDPKLGISIYRRTESSNASLLVEAALVAAEREIGAVSSPILEDSDREANLYSISNELDFKATCSQNQAAHRSPEGHLESYMPDELAASPASQITSHARHTPPSHIHLDYHLHRPVDYANMASRAHNIEQYLEQQDVQRVIHDASRYQEISHSQQHHHQHPQSQVSNDVLSSDEGDSVAQNLSLPIKEKSLQQLELVKYDGLESEFVAASRERVRFEPLIVQAAGDQGLDMSARGFQQAFGSPVQNSGHHHHHHHHHHLYEMSERERQGVDLSRTAACVSPTPYPPPYPPPYSHVDVPRVVSLEPASRSHHLHTSVSRIISSPQPASSLTSHLVPETFEARLLSPPPPSIPAYNTTYSVGPTSYHSSRSGYHYSGYY